MNAQTAAPMNVGNILMGRMQYRADPLADATIDRILGPWNHLPESLAAAKLLVASAESSKTLLAAQWQPQWQKLASVSRTFEQWSDNRNVIGWRPNQGLAPEIGAPLMGYVNQAHGLPEWADRSKLERAEALFMEYGALSVTILFCSSLPECYVIPDLAAVLHATGQLEKHTEYRIRATGAMIFPVMMRGGLTEPEGGGVRIPA